MSADLPLNRVAAAWLAKLSGTKEEGQAASFDHVAFLAGYLEAHARDRAEAVYLGLDEYMEAAPRTLSDLEEHVTLHGLVMLEAWAETMAAYGTAGEPWAKEAADRAALAYRDRVADLMDTADAGGRA